MQFTTIKKSAEFRRIFEAGKANCAVNSYTAVYAQKNDRSGHRFGIVVSGKIGKAVVRNKVRRRIREILRALQKNELQAETCFDIVVIARKNAVNTEFGELYEGIRKLVRKLIK